MNRRHHHRLARALLAVTVLLAAACSGSDDGAGSGGDSTTTTGPPGTPPTTEESPMTDTELAAETYVAGYPLVVSTRTLQRLGGLVGVNELFWQSALSGPETRVIVAPNRDTLYSIAIVDLRAGPLALTLPEITDRYFTYQLLDGWTESFAYVGTRATGGRAGTWVLTPPGWEGELPAGAEQVEAPTNRVFLLGRYLVDDEADVADVQALAEEVSLRPLAELTGDEPPPEPPPLGDPPGAPQDVPTDASFFTELSAALAVDPPTTPAQQELFARAEEAGIVGDGPDGVTAPDDVLEEGAAEGQRRIAERVGSTGSDAGWSDPGRVGTYGDDLLQRAVVARVGWGANVPEEAVYRLVRTDADGEALDGSEPRVMRFAADALPPVDAFWSLTAYGPDLFLTPHPSGRWSIGDRSPDLVVEDDGSVEVALSHAEPAPRPDGSRPSWLPVPEGPYVLMLRLYLPQAEAIDGTWAPPPIEATG